MPLTRPRAHQFEDSDYKESVRVISTSNITLSGGAPATLDGVSLTLNDRILVTGQTIQSENGLYKVTTVGSGSNGTWARTRDGDQQGDISAGMTVMVSSGTTYGDTRWKLITDDPITLGTTSLEFEQDSAYAFGQVDVDGTTLTADKVNDLLTITSGNNIATSADASTDTLTISVSDTPSFTSMTASGNITGGNISVSGSATITGDLDLNDGDSIFVHGDTGYVNKRYVLYGTTTDANATELFIGGTANSRVEVANNTTMFYTVDIVARRTDAADESAGWQLKGVCDNHSGTTADVGDVYEVAVARDDVNWVVDVLSDDTEDAVVVTVTGAAGKTVKWMAVVKTMEIAN